MRLLTTVRDLLHGSPRDRALATERHHVQRAQLAAHSLEERITNSYCGEVSNAVELGTAVRGARPVRLAADRLKGHWLIVGPSGAGKSFFLTLLLSAFLRAGVVRFLLLDPKQEALRLAERAVVDHIHGMPEQMAEDLARRVLMIDPYSKSALPALQILAPEPGLDIELQAFEVATLLTSEINLGVGIRQEGLLIKVIEALCHAQLPLTVLPTALSEPALFEALAEQGLAPDILRSTAARLRQENRERVLGLVSRAEALLRLRSSRLSLGASTCLDFAELLDENLTMMNLSPPQGSDDIARFWRGILWSKLTHAIRRRPNGAAPVVVAIDEFPSFLAAGGSRLAEGCEDILRLARSKRCYFLLLTQDLASVGKLSPTLPQVIRDNCHLQAVFRSRDNWDALLPVTGTRPRLAGLPWEEKRPGFLERGAERELLREELSRLPDRELYLWDQRTGVPGIRMKSADLTLRASARDVALLEGRSLESRLIQPVASLEKSAAAVSERVARLLQGGSLSTASPLKRPRAKAPVEHLG